MDLGRRLRDQGYRQIIVGDLRVRHIAGTSSSLPDVRRLAWFRASALVDYLAATHSWVTARLMCAILGLGALLRAGYDILRGRTGRLSEFGTHAIAFTFPGRTIDLVRAQRQDANARRPVTRQKYESFDTPRVRITGCEASSESAAVDAQSDMALHMGDFTVGNRE
jgi:GT2 family glycosyltransferase